MDGHSVAAAFSPTPPCPVSCHLGPPHGATMVFLRSNRCKLRSQFYPFTSRTELSGAIKVINRVMSLGSAAQTAQRAALSSPRKNCLHVDRQGRPQPPLYVRRHGDADLDLRIPSAIRTPTDIFPNIGIPVVSVVWTYNGLPPDDMSAASSIITSARSVHRSTTSSISNPSR